MKVGAGNGPKWSTTYDATRAAPTWSRRAKDIFTHNLLNNLLLVSTTSLQR